MNCKQMPLHLQPHPPTQPAEASVAMSEPEPLWRRVKTIERVLNWLGVLPPDQVDDRGAKIPRFSDEHVRCAVREEDPSAASRASTILGLGMIGSVLVAYIFVTIRQPLMTSLPTAFLIIIATAVARSTSKTRATQLGTRAATLLESSRCGACAHLIDDASARGVDFVRCAECGSQWNMQRVDGARADDTFIVTISKPHSMLEEPVLLRDDRLVSRRFTKASVKSMKAAARGTVPDFDRRRALLTRMKARGFRRGLVLSLRWSFPTLVLCCSATVYAAHISQPTYLEFVSFSLRVCAGIAAMVIIFSGVTAFSHVQTHRYLRNVGLCPTCHGPLDPSAPPEFDGCIRCTTCGCLWKRDAIAGEVAPDQPQHARSDHPTSASPNAAP